MKAPTTEEISYGYDKLTEDGPMPGKEDLTLKLSMLVALNPQIVDTLRRQAIGGLQHGLITLGEEGLGGVEAWLGGALIYGLHLGLHIGEARAVQKGKEAGQ